MAVEVHVGDITVCVHVCVHVWVLVPAYVCICGSCTCNYYRVMVSNIRPKFKVHTHVHVHVCTQLYKNVIQGAYAYVCTVSLLHKCIQNVCTCMCV